MNIPEPYLELSLRNVLALARTPIADGQPVEVATITSALEALATQLEAQKREKERDDREWLADQFDKLPTEIEED